MEKTLTDLFKSTNALKTLICNEASEYNIYDKLSEIEKLCIEHKQEICSTHEKRVVARKGEKIIEDVPVKYLTLAVNTIIKDATETINQYIRDHLSELEGTRYYIIKCYSNNRGYKMTCLYTNSVLKMNGLKGLVNSFSGYEVLFDMLNMEPNNILIKSDYDRFVKLSNNKDYIKPYIQDILTKLHQVKIREK